MTLATARTHPQRDRAKPAVLNRREPPDLTTVSAELRRHERFDLVGGFAALGNLISEVPTAVHIAYYARNVGRTAILRRLIEAGGKIAAAGYDDSQKLTMTLDHAERTRFAVSQRRGDQDWRHLAAARPSATWGTPHW